jgi:hypothetical protein
MASSMARWVWLVAFVGACGTSGSDPDSFVIPAGFHPPAAPTHGVQLYGRPFVVEPGEDVFMCVYLPDVLDADLDVVDFSTYQMEGGHHVVLSAVEEGYEPVDNLHRCLDTEMIHHRFLSVGGADPAQGLGLLPERVALKIPGKTRLVIQSHYINADTEPMTVMDAVNMHTATGPIDVYASVGVQADITFRLPAGQTTVRDLNCVVGERSNVFLLLGHTHEMGRRFTFERTPKGGKREMLYDQDVYLGFRDSPPLLTWPREAPLVLEPGDELHMRCEWDNTGRDDLRFPKEMCAALFYYYPGRGFEICISEGDTFGTTIGLL